jgi:hypothetical protein
MVMVEIPFDTHREIRRRPKQEFGLVVARATGDPLRREAGKAAEQALNAGGYFTRWSEVLGASETPCLLVDTTDRQPELISARVHALGARVVPERFDSEVAVAKVLPFILQQAPNYAIDGSDTLVGIRFVSDRISDDWWHIIRYVAQFEHTPRE